MKMNITRTMFPELIGRPKKETAEKCGISRSYVSRIEKRALLKLREVLGEDSCPY